VIHRTVSPQIAVTRNGDDDDDDDDDDNDDDDDGDDDDDDDDEDVLCLRHFQSGLSIPASQDSQSTRGSTAQNPVISGQSPAPLMLVLLEGAIGYVGVSHLFNGPG
jgi:hypothetical protein